MGVAEGLVRLLLQVGQVVREDVPHVALEDLLARGQDADGAEDAHARDGPVGRLGVRDGDRVQMYP